MNILYHHRIASKDGQFVHVEELTNALAEQKHKLKFVAPKFAESSDFGSEGGIAAKLKKKLPQWFYELLELNYAWLIALKLIIAIIKERPDFIYERYNLYQPAGVIVAKLFRLPILLEVNAPLYDERKKYSGIAIDWLARWSERFTWRHATAVLPVTQVLKDIIVEQGIDPDKVHVIHNGINQHMFDQIANPRSVASGRQLTVGFVGFINPWHRLDIAIDAIAELKDEFDIRLLCVGDGDHGIRQALEQQCEQAGIADKVEFTGLKKRDEVFSYVKQFDIALQPAVTPYASPLKLFEYLAVGSLIVAPNTSNIREVLSEDNAVLFKADDADDFKGQLKFAIARFDELQGRRTKARQLILSKGYTWQNNARRVTELVRP
jgi:glycosyltransferase involved in cell wall biosynthesis